VVKRLSQSTLSWSHDDEHLLVKFIELPEPDGTRPWALILHEFSHSIPLPDELARELTPSQIEVAKRILRNWSDRMIAEDLGRSHGTIKTHVRAIYATLKCDGRTDFMYQAARFLKPV
jgi:DNA-binding NarL/FixJ family response regulator